MDSVVHVLVCLALLNAATPAEDDKITLDELFQEQKGRSLNELSFHTWSEMSDQLEIDISKQIQPFLRNETLLPLSEEILEYLRTIQYKIMSDFATDLGNSTVTSICDDLNDHCTKHSETPIEDITVEPSNLACVTKRLRKTLSVRVKTVIAASLQKLSRRCTHQLLPLCSAVNANCTLAFQERIGKLIGNFIEDTNEVAVLFRSTPLDVIAKFVVDAVGCLASPYRTVYSFLTITATSISTVPSIEPFTLGNLLSYDTDEGVERSFFRAETATETQEQFSWGIIRSNAGSVSLPCSHNRDIYPRDSRQYLNFLHRCYFVNIFQLQQSLLLCAYSDPTSTPLAWSTAPSAYFHSQCLCLVFNGTKCFVEAPQGVDPRLYCLSVLLRDFQRQVSYRPAVTYLDYAFQTRVPVCQFTNLLQIAFKKDCVEPELNSYFHLILSVQCYFKDLVNKHLNCSETSIVNTFNGTELCALQIFMQSVVCDGDGDVKVPVPYYGAGDSTLVLVLTFVDVAVRVLTLFTYLACPQLRNLPGKLLIGYQVTALLRLLVVRASLADMALAVRLDVAMDLASTLWLTAYLHFLTTSIMALRLPDSLSRDEARMVLLRYTLFGWALPAALSAAFFCMNEALDSRVQVGQLLFVLCNYVALFGNLYMFYKNFQFYYDVKKNALQFRQGVTARSVFADLFNFALKTSLLSGAGITIRLVFTQIQGMEHLLGYYHALGTLQGLLFFVLYGCNSEARAFWKLVVFSNLPLCRSRENAIV